MVKLLGDIIYGIGRIVGGVKYRFGVIVHIPERFRRSSNADVHPDNSSPFRRF